MPNSLKVPVPTLERLATYLTALSNLRKQGVDTVSSTDIEERTGVNAAQFRKDLSYFGEFGKPGIGYKVDDLHSRIKQILNLESIQPVLLVGVGNLGSALMGYPALRSDSFRIVAAFDNDRTKIGQLIWSLVVKDIADIAKVNESLNAKIGIIAVPAPAAQEVADKLVEADVLTILNFVPVALRLPKHVAVRNVDFVQELAVLSYHLSEDEQAG